MNYRIIYKNDFISHHGILGQKWGKRNGPPYPLNYKDYSASEKKVKITRKQALANDQYLKSKVKEHILKSDLNKINRASERFVNLSSEMAEGNASAFKSFVNDKKFKDLAFKELKKDFGSGVDDEEFFDLEKYSAIGIAALDYRSKDLKNKEDEMWKAGNEYFDLCEDLSKELLEDYGSLQVSDMHSNGGVRTGSEVLKSYVLDNMKDAAFNSYIFRHYNDYWVYDLPEFSELCESITAHEYNKWVNKEKFK